MTDEVTQATVEPTLTSEPTIQPSGREAFINSLPEEYRADPIFANFEGLDGLAKSYASAAKMVGMDKNQVVAIPKEQTPEAMAAVWDKLGRPSDITGYGLDQFKEVLPEEALKSYADIAHKSGVSKEAFSGLISKYVEEATGAQKAAQEAAEQQIIQWQGEVKKEFGAAYEEKMSFARKAVESFGLSEIVKENMAVFENPALVKALAAIGEKTSEGLVLSTGAVTHGKLSPAEAKMELAKFETDKDNIKILLDKTHPMHEHIAKKRSDLYKYAYQE